MPIAARPRSLPSDPSSPDTPGGRQATYAVDKTCMALEGEDALPVLAVPDLHRLVGASSARCRPCPGWVLDPAGMALEGEVAPCQSRLSQIFTVWSWLADADARRSAERHAPDRFIGAKPEGRQLCRCGVPDLHRLVALAGQALAIRAELHFVRPALALEAQSSLPVALVPESSPSGHCFLTPGAGHSG